MNMQDGKLIEQDTSGLMSCIRTVRYRFQIKSGDPKPQGINGPWWKDTYSWVGLGCNLEELDDIIKNKKYIVEDKSKYQAHKEKFLTYPNRHGYEVLSEQIVEHLGKLKL